MQSFSERDCAANHSMHYADYVITLNKNQDNLDREVEKLFSQGISTGCPEIGIDNPSC